MHSATAARPSTDDAASVTAGDQPAPMVTAPTSDPTTPPIENMPWKADMIGRPYSRSVRTACEFIDTSRAPLPNPKTSSARPSCHAVDASPGPITAIDSRIPLSATSSRLPYRSASGPANCIPAIAPSASSRSSDPSVEWAMFVRSSIAGMWTTHIASRKPLMPNTPKIAARAAVRWRGRGVGVSTFPFVPNPARS